VHRERQGHGTVAMMLAVHAALLAWQPQPAAIRVGVRRRSAPPAAFDDTAFVVAAGTILAAAGYLQYSLSAGEQGLNAFLMKEKSQNPFYKASFKADKPQGASWFTLKLPNLQYVEVYGQRPERATGDRSRVDLYTELDAAVEREDYAAAAEIKRRIDQTYGGGPDGEVT